ncbi:alpha/beta fold hydrolase [Mycobacteroides immunogenum]|uniref:alpha/beta fold hydrolase n=1 Tax=Mycobacteroides immunogenum TaxID=83262 RepID=UPI000993C5F3|nr:alpha/beta hydrolase [Mycobacteroides immunogenum]MCV7305204.1 alpha/beta hydrolase [Mycobacteroides immunogenum]WJR32079.1 alpha/beta hydrolase [Mycobacteroides immunogenum]
MSPMPEIRRPHPGTPPARDGELHQVVTIDGRTVQVNVSGPDKGTTVVMLAAAGHFALSYRSVCERLHTAGLRTAVIGHDPHLHAKAITGVLDDIGVKVALLVGDRAGGELAWDLAASKLDRFIGLVAIDRGHPRVADRAGLIRDKHCPPVEINTTVLVTSDATRAIARASQRFVYGDYRIVELMGRRSATRDLTPELAAEVVLRSSSW